jgi:methionyl-tRNA synthetase
MNLKESKLNFWKGDGTRKGNGKCKCNTGFGGDMCEKCKNGYFQIEANNDKTIRCVGL